LLDVILYKQQIVTGTVTKQKRQNFIHITIKKNKEKQGNIFYFQWDFAAAPRLKDTLRQVYSLLFWELFACSINFSIKSTLRVRFDKDNY